MVKILDRFRNLEYSCFMDDGLTYGDIKQTLGRDRVEHSQTMPSDYNVHGGDEAVAWVVFGTIIGITWFVKEFKEAI